MIKKLFLISFLYLTWLVPQCNEPWNLIDQAIFHIFNSSLYLNHSWALSWAWLNTDLADRVQDIFVLTLTVMSFYYCNDYLSTKQRAKNFFFYYIALTISSITLKILLHQGLGIHRFSPSLLDDGTFRLSYLIENFHVKDSSRRSFPADHALFLCMWGQYILRQSTPLFHKLTCYGIIIFFSLPRLFSGAHWFTDLFFGGVLLSYIFFYSYTLISKYISKKQEAKKTRDYSSQRCEPSQ